MGCCRHERWQVPARAPAGREFPLDHEPRLGREPRLGIDIGKVIINGPAHPGGGDTAFFTGNEATMLATPEMDGAIRGTVGYQYFFGPQRNPVPAYGIHAVTWAELEPLIEASLAPARPATPPPTCLTRMSTRLRGDISTLPR